MLDSDPQKTIRKYHPTWEMQRGVVAQKPPLKRWEVLPFPMDWVI
jgi:hypothetical protein